MIKASGLEAVETGMHAFLAVLGGGGVCGVWICSYWAAISLFVMVWDWKMTDLTELGDRE